MSTARNQPCPCGSGLKFKRCCGPQPGLSERLEEKLAENTAPLRILSPAESKLLQQHGIGREELHAATRPLAEFASSHGLQRLEITLSGGSYSIDYA